MSNPSEYIRLVKYALLQTTTSPSIACDLLVFIYFIRHWRKEILTAPQNHVILCLLIISFIYKIAHVPFFLFYLRWGIVFLQTNTFCGIWNWLNYSLYAINLHLLTWCCIERHLFVFHNQMMKKKWCLIFLHYIPLIGCLLYAPLFYFIVIYFPRSCINIWYYTIAGCGGPCFALYDQVLGTFELLFHYGTPMFIIIFSNLILSCRIIWQKLQRQRRIQWNRQKRMIIQLIFISALYFVLTSPSVIVNIIQVLWVPDFLIDIQYKYLNFIAAFTIQFFPFVIIGSLPEMHKELKKWIGHVRRFFYRGRRTHPVLAITTVIGRNSGNRATT